jgi:hypothetical protein
MVLNVKAIVYNLLKNSATLTALVPVSRILYMYPKEFTTFPIVTYEETNQRTVEYADDDSQAVNSGIQIHVWTKNGSTSTISQIISGIMIADEWDLELSQDVGDPNFQIEHRVMRFSKVLNTGGI